jgi:hypothetical protein
LIAEGHVPDSTRWWIDRWEDETVSNGAVPPGAVTRQPARSEANPLSTTSWGSIKVLYR